MKSLKQDSHLWVLCFLLCAVHLLRIANGQIPPVNPFDASLQVQAVQDFNLANEIAIQSAYINSFRTPSLFQRFWPFFLILLIIPLIPRSSETTTTTTTTTTLGCPAAPDTIALGMACCPNGGSLAECTALGAECTFVSSTCIYNCATFNGQAAQCAATNQCTFTLGIICS